MRNTLYYGRPACFHDAQRRVNMSDKPADPGFASDSMPPVAGEIRVT